MSKSSPKRRKMKRFSLQEISAVDKPAQEGALAMIMKRDRGGLVEQIVKAYLDSSDGFAAHSHAQIAKHATAEKADPCQPLLAALETSLQSIVRDDSLSDKARLSLMKASAGDFLKAAKEELPDIEAYLQKGFSEGAEMNLSQLRKQMQELSRKVDSLAPKLEMLVKQRTAKADDDEMMEDDGGEEEAAERLRTLLGQKNASEYSMSEYSEKADEDDFDFDEDTEKAEDAENEKPTTEGDEEEPIAAGSASPIGGKRATKRDDVIEVGGRTISKAAVGADMFAVLQSQQRAIEQLSKRADDERYDREMVEFTKRAQDELSHLPGTPAQKARILMALGDSLDKDERQVLTKMLRAGNAASSAAFRTVGHRYDKMGSTGNDFTKRVSEIRARDNCSRTDAMQKARREFPGEFAAYQGH